jgi:hypothetical protein
MKYFEEYNKTDELDEEVKVKLVIYRELLGQPVTITSGFETSGHATNSEHGETLNGKPNSKAVDCKSKASLDWQYTCAVKAGFRCIGLYPAWNGVHLGVRGSIDRRWIGLGSGNKQEYIKFNKENYDKYILNKGVKSTI